jgi:steroid delta-isomerase
MTNEIDLDRLVRFYEALEPSTLREGLRDIYAPAARFKDPFNEVRGVDAIEAIFTHMYQQVIQPRFVITTRAINGSDAFLTWDFIYRMKRFTDAPQCIRGATHLRFDAAGKVELHRDYWDAAEELYEKLPLVGTLMRWLKRKAGS